MPVMRDGAVRERNHPQPMLTRSAANAAVGRASAMRRMRRRSANAGIHAQPSRLYCSTNGCTSFLVIDDAGRTASCQICGFTRRVH